MRSALAATIALTAALAGWPGLAEAAPTDSRLDLFLRALRAPAGAPAGPATTTQATLERVLRMLPPAAAGHGGGEPPLINGRQGAASSDTDLSAYAFCYEACRTERAASSCGTPGPRSSRPPSNLCRAIEFTPAISALIGPQLGAGASPFVDDKGDDPSQQPAGYTFLGQFIDHDVTRTQTALSALGKLNRGAQGDPILRAKLAAAGVTPEQLSQAAARAGDPTSALSVNTGKLDLDSVYGVVDFAALSGVTAPWFEQQGGGAYTGRFAQRHIRAPAAFGPPIDGFDYQRLPDGGAQLPDPRNSENKIISQIQNLFELAHNDCMDRTLGGTGSPTQQQIGAAFDACHKKVIWTYETIVATDFLPRFSAEASLRRVSGGALHAYRRGPPAASELPSSPDRVNTSLYSCKPGLGSNAEIHIPHEFAVAAFRLGHTLVRNSYVLHDTVVDADGKVLPGQQRPIFAAAADPETVGLVGSNPLQPGDVIDWSYFYDTANGETAQPGRPVDALIVEKLFMLPVAALPPGPDNGRDTTAERNLPRRNLMRASEQTSRITGSVGLATGEEVEAYARERIPDLHDATKEVRQLLGSRLKSAGFDPQLLRERTPLWLFILAEAESTQASMRLGELGSHLIDEFLLGSLRCDQGSVLYAAPADLSGWGPTEAIAGTRRYSMPQLIAYLEGNAKVDGQPIRLLGH